VVNWGLIWTAVPVIVAGAGLLVTGMLRRRSALVLAGTAVSAIGVLAGVAGWLLVADPKAGLAEALKTGGIAGAAVVALYGLWLNDRRRRVEEDRHQLDTGRLAHERFARAVEMLGNDADQVRVGAMHAMVGLARDTPAYTQTVLDVLCSYLRRPFDHPNYRQAHDPDQQDFANRLPGQFDEAFAVADQERQVRLTAKRLITELLPPAGAKDAPHYDLDLTGATIEYLDLAGRQVGGILARRAALFGITRMAGVEFHGSALFSGSTFFGWLELPGAAFHNGISLYNVTFATSADLTDVAFRGFADLRVTQLRDPKLTGATVDSAERVKLPDGWHAESRAGSTIAAIVHKQGERA
jgi:hypothetical protein